MQGRPRMTLNRTDRLSASHHVRLAKEIRLATSARIISVLLPFCYQQAFYIQGPPYVSHLRGVYYSCRILLVYPVVT